MERKQPAMREDAFAFAHPDWAMLRSERHKYIRYNSLAAEVLYDLDESPHEVANRAADPEHAAALARMRERMLTRALDASRSVLPKRWRF
jgi:arylsulfatase A-like enzyme